MVSAPTAALFADWASAVRAARSSASSLAYYTAATRFLGKRWRPTSDLPIVGVWVRIPPVSGAYKGYSNATQAELQLEWTPRLHSIVGGPYVVTGRATAAILRNHQGRWMPVLVE
jgi:hypothetical protein